MKKEVLRIQNLSCLSPSGRSLSHVSFYLLQGEITGFLGLADSGKDTLVDILTGKEKYDKGFVSAEGGQLAAPEEMESLVYKIVDSNYSIKDWSVAEYIGLVTNDKIMGMLRKKSLKKEIQRLFDRLRLGIDVNKKLGELGEMEKRLADVAKACFRKARLLIIEDEFEGLSEEEIQTFQKELSRLIRGRMAVIINSHSDMVTRNMADRLLIFKEGRIAKKCCAGQIQSTKYLEKLFMGSSLRSRKKTMDNRAEELTGPKEIVYEVSPVNMGGQELRLSFHKGEIAAILAVDRKWKEDIFWILSGRVNRHGMERLLEGKICRCEDISGYVRNKIVSASHLGNLEELLPSMSVGENILMPSLNKLSSLECAVAEKKIARLLERDIESAGIKSRTATGELGTNERIALTLERWLLYRPKVMVLLEPFALCDAYGVSLVKFYLKKIAAGGTAVIAVLSRKGYMAELGDRFINLEASNDAIPL